MNKKTNRYQYIFLLFIIFIFLFPNNKVLAESYTVDGTTYTYSTEDDGTDGPDVSTLKFELTGYGGSHLGSGVDVSKFTTNSTYGWQEYEVDGTKYVVIAAATHEMLNAHKGETGSYWFYGAKFDHIHYFRYKDTIQFKFADQKFDSNVYNAMILDSGDLMMFPQEPRYHREKNVNAFDIYFGVDGESNPNVSKISGKKVYATSTGVFSQNASQEESITTKSGGQFLLKCLKTLFTLVGDMIQILIDSIDIEDDYTKKLTYPISEIQNDENLANELQIVTNSSSVDINSTGENNEQEEEIDKTETLKNVIIPNTIDNEKGEKETVYTVDTEISVIPIDIFTCATNQIDLFDIDLFNTSSKNSNKFWNLIRNFTSIVSHIVLYISVALLITMLIIRSIMLVITSVRDDPRRAAESKKIMDRWVKAIVLIVGIYVLMIAILYLYLVIINMIMDGKVQKYPIRVTVENVYSFNTNIIGYLKYMVLNSNVIASFGYAILYDFVVILNLIWVVFMFVRLLVIAGFVIIAPITAVIYTLDKGELNKNSILNFKTWLKLYIVFVWVPIIVVIIQKLILIIG